MEPSCKNSISLHLFPPSNFRLQPLSILFCLLSNSCHLPSSGLAPSTIPLLAHSAFLLYFLLSSAYKPVQISIVLKLYTSNYSYCLLSLYPFKAIYPPFSTKTALRSSDASSWKTQKSLFCFCYCFSAAFDRVEHALCLENLSTIHSTTQSLS